MNLGNPSAGFLYKMKLYQKEEKRWWSFLELLIRQDFGLKKPKGEEREVFLDAFKNCVAWQ